MSFAGFSKVVKVFKRNKTKLPVPIKKGIQLIDADSNVAYEFNGDEWVVLPFYAELSDISSSSDRDAIRRANERERACKSVPYSTAKENTVGNTHRDSSVYRSYTSTNDANDQIAMAAILSDESSVRSSYSSDSCSSSYSSSHSSSHSSYSSDSGSSCDSSSSSSCD
jgi:hypothetical protein